MIKMAILIGRTPAALAMKLTNIASLDPAITSTGRKGPEGASAADKAVCEEMQSDWGYFAVEMQQAIHALGTSDEQDISAGEPGMPEEAQDYTGKKQNGSDNDTYWAGILSCVLYSALMTIDAVLQDWQYLNFWLQAI